jgi:hypothetical protein
MSASGGVFAKLGGGYELRWTARHLLQLLDGRVTEMRIEPPRVAEGIEFYVRRPSIAIEFHQAKRQHTQRGKWTISLLEGVLSVFYERLNEPGAHCVFVSANQATELERLAWEARKAVDLDKFLESAIRPVDGLDKAFKELCTVWGGASEAEAFERVGRVRTRAIDEDSIQEWNEELARVTVNAHPIAVTDALEKIANEKVKERLTRDVIIEALGDRTYELHDWAAGSSAVDEILAGHVADCLRRTARGFSGRIVVRRETSDLIDLVEDDDGPRRVLVTGRGGFGKSTVINEAIRHFRNRGWRILPVVLDDVDEVEFLNTEDLGRRYGLPSTPTAVLASTGDPALLVVDQLDRASMDRGDRAPLAETVSRLAKQALAHPHLRVVISCRTAELAADPRFRQLGETDEASGLEPATVDVGLLDPDDVREVVDEAGLSASELRDEQLELLRDPYHLKLLIGSADAGVPLDFHSAEDLLKRFEKVRREQHG